MFKYFSIKHYIIIGVLSILSAGWLIQNVSIFPYQLAIEMKSNSNGQMQIYYAKEHASFSEPNSFLIPVKKSTGFETYSITLHKKNIKNIRIDPVGDFQIKSIKIRNRFHSNTYEKLELVDLIQPLNNIEGLALTDNDYVEGHVVEEHPSFQLQLQQPVNQLSTLSRIICIFVTALIFFVVYYFLYLLYAKHKDWLTNAVDITIPKKLFLLLVCCIFAWLAFQNIYYATTIKQGISPDETHHLTVSRLYADPGTLFIKDAAEPIPGTSDCKLSEQPYLYHLLLGKSLLLNILRIPDYLFLRFVNIVISILSLYFTLLLVKEITKNRWVQLTVLVLQTNILMYVFLSSMISYDNLCNLLSVLSFLFLLRYLRSYSRTQLILLLLAMSMGTLTKISFFPVVVVQAVILLWYSKAISKHKQRLFNKSISGREIILLVMLIAFIILNLKLWVGNPDLLRRYKYLSSQPVPLDKVNKHNLQTYQASGLLTTQTIQVSIVNLTKSEMPIYETIPHYLIRTEETIFGIMAHKNLLRKNNDLLLYRVLFFFSMLLFIMNFRKRMGNSKLCIIAASALMYMVIIFYVNYTGYLVSGHFGAALQGRYNFPILVLLIIFLAYNLLINFNDRIKILFLLIITPLLIYNNYFWFITNVTPDWFIIP